MGVIIREGLLYLDGCYYKRGTIVSGWVLLLERDYCIWMGVIIREGLLYLDGCYY
jgi:hypothetical protein